MEPQLLVYALKCPGAPDPINRGLRDILKSQGNKLMRVKKVKKNKKYKFLVT